MEFPRLLPRLHVLLALGGLFAFAPLARVHAEAAGVIQIAGAPVFSVENNAGIFTVKVERTGGSAGAVSARYATADGSAQAGRDYTPVSGTLSWADGDSSVKSVKVTIMSQPDATSPRSFTVGLSQPTGGASIGNVNAILTVMNTAQAPTLVISSPPVGIPLTAGETIPLAATVSDPSGVLSKVQFYLNGQLVGETGPYGAHTFNAVAPAAAGDYELKAVAIDTSGDQSAAVQPLTLLANDPANPSPAAATLTDLDGRALASGSKVTLSVAAIGAGGLPLQRVDFYADGVLFDSIVPEASGSRRPILRGREAMTRAAGDAVTAGSVFNAKYTMPGTDKLVSLISVALSQAGRAHVSAPVSVQAVASTSDHPPRVAVRGVTNGARVPVGVAVDVPVTITDPDAGDSSSEPRKARPRGFDVSPIIARVQYYLNGLMVKDSKSAPFGFSFSPPSAGAYVVSAIATDGSGLSTVSKPVTVEAAVLTEVTLTTVQGGRAVRGGAQPGRVLFTRSGGSISGDLTVAYEFKSAAGDEASYQTVDGQPLNGVFVIPAGSTRKKLKVALPASGASSDKLKFRLLPSPDGSYQVGGSARARIIVASE